jgi:hypothetical protein
MRTLYETADSTDGQGGAQNEPTEAIAKRAEAKDLHKRSNHLGKALGW